jgi:hypothetical protein
MSGYGMHSESTRKDPCLDDVLQDLSQDDLEGLETLVRTMIGHSYMVAESIDTGLDDFDKNLALAGEFSKKFGVRKDTYSDFCTYSNRVHNIINKTKRFQGDGIENDCRSQEDGGCRPQQNNRYC